MPALVLLRIGLRAGDLGDDGFGCDDPLSEDLRSEGLRFEDLRSDDLRFEDLRVEDLRVNVWRLKRGAPRLR